MDEEIKGIQDLSPLDKPEIQKNKDSIRYLSFNVNGIKTLFHYFPWNRLRLSFDLLFGVLSADIVSLQELKLSSNNVSSSGIGNIKNYRAFISLPKKKKGYSGVGLFIRIPGSNEPERLKSNLTIVKAEEGLSGHLKSPDVANTKYRDLDTAACIGGYPEIDEKRGLEIDSQGRSVCVELASGIIIFSVYCPANSGGSQEGETFRLDFLRILLQRCYKLKFDLKKEVVLMGDVNVCLDLIDHAETLKILLHQNILKRVPDTSNSKSAQNFEELNKEQCISFKQSSPARELLNSYVKATFDFETQEKPTQIFYDTTRLIQKRRKKMYTVWNTLTSAREVNYGSRIDFILTSSEQMKESLVEANIWPFLMGSDHCPVVADFIPPEISTSTILEQKDLRLEAKKFFNLVQHRSILSIFNQAAKRKSSSENEKKESHSSTNKRQKPQHFGKVTNTKPGSEQTKISHFFFKENDNQGSSNKQSNGVQSVNHLCLKDPKSLQKQNQLKQDSVQVSQPLSISNISNIYGIPPSCHHDIPCQLKTVLKSGNNKGRRFWCCSKPSSVKSTSNDLTNPNAQCNFFKWAIGREDKVNN